MTQAALNAVLAYHARSKHDYHRFAPALGFLDWDTQPDPFRRYEGAPLVGLPLPQGDPGPSYEQLYHPGSIAPRPFDAMGLSGFLFYSLALSAWKRFEQAHWSLRVNPSSGNLHPTEAYLLLPGLPGIADAPALHHYAPKEHGLELRARLDEQRCRVLAEQLPASAFLVGLASIPWRESWKYGERAWRYCQHDAGHALAALRYAAALLGWKLIALPDVPDAALGHVLGLDRSDEFVDAEPEHGDLLAVVLTRPEDFDASAFVLDASLVDDAGWAGHANTLSSGHHDWSVVEEVERATRKREAWTVLHVERAAPVDPLPLDASEDVPPAGRILRQRRSAVALDGRTGITRQAFYDMLSRTVPDRSAVPWDALTWPTFVHLGIFVHRVGELPPGLYALARDPGRVEFLRGTMKDGFVWERPEGCPDTLPLYLLEEGDAQRLATGVSCGQEIAGQGAFSLGMLAEYEEPLRSHGPALYRHLYWETGAIGQVLYLEAEAAGIRSTGIGCFFDDPVHRAFGIEGRAVQSLYHFTVGGAVNDPRITTEPAYEGLAEG